MGCAFDLELLQSYNGEKHGYDVVEDIERFQIVNLCKEDEKHFHEFCSELADDYNQRRANYLAYFKQGLNARTIWELRKSAILWRFMEGEKDPWFFEGHTTDMDFRGVKEYRSSILIQKFRDYEDHDWQYYWVLECALGVPFAQSYYDMEMAFEDRDEFKPDDLGDPPRDLAWRLVPVESYQMKCRQGRPEWMGVPKYR